jgi:superoxide dismutase
MLPETLSTAAGAGVGAGGMYGAGKLSDSIDKLNATSLENTIKSRNAHIENINAAITDPSKVTSGMKRELNKLKKTMPDATLEDLVKHLTGGVTDMQKQLPLAKLNQSGLGKALKFLSKNKRFAIPGAALAAGAGALGLHNLID